MQIKYLITTLILVFLFSGCSGPEIEYEPQYRTYVLDGSENTINTYTIEEYEPVDLFEQYKQDRQEIESYRKYRAARNLADKEKEERERIDCYQKEDKDPDEYYLEECED